MKNHGSDELVRSFTTKRQLLALLYGQLSGACSLRDVEASMKSHQGRLYHAGGFAPARSTFADANRSQSEVFSGLVMHMLAMTTRGLRRKLSDVVRLINSTGLHLAGIGTNWARFSTDVCGAKAHVVYDPDLGCPIYHMITEANARIHHDDGFAGAVKLLSGIEGRQKLLAHVKLLGDCLSGACVAEFRNVLHVLHL